ncbi:hypothetical protein [Helicobacter cinaedi]|uniref:hypothetical protein n=1 Tax=Helicobacter cinaedi TaxID=213 RepID=UPI001F21A44F|nr:hypothetical protein [Helicobacter cinaedi]
MSVKRRFWQVCICVNMLSVGYADTLSDENALSARQTHINPSYTSQDSDSYPARERKNCLLQLWLLCKEMYCKIPLICLGKARIRLCIVVMWQSLCCRFRLFQ